MRTQQRYPVTNANHNKNIQMRSSTSTPLDVGDCRWAVLHPHFQGQRRYSLYKNIITCVVVLELLPVSNFLLNTFRNILARATAVSPDIFR